MAKFLTRYYRELLLGLLILLILAPIFYYGRPLHLSTPDIKYLKAKVVQMSLGSLYADPVTGYDTFHPPYYYLFLAGLCSLGLSIDMVLILMAILQVILIIYLSYAVLMVVFDRTTAFLSCLLIPFIVQFMGGQNILLANSFYFSVPFYLAGLYFYLQPKSTSRQTVLAAIFWGLAFLISPVYFFLLGLTFLYELAIRKNVHRFLLLAAVFVITIIPFYIQAAVIMTQHLWGTSAFALWRGVPDMKWLAKFGREFISPSVYNVGLIPAVLHGLILLVAVMTMILKRKWHWFIPLSLLAYLMTAYHFSGQYAIRIQIFFSLFLVAATIANLRGLTIRPYLWLLPLCALVVYSFVPYYRITVRGFLQEGPISRGFHEMGDTLWKGAAACFDKGRFVFCTKITYFDYLAPAFPVHALGAYKTLEYFQLNSRLATELETDYQAALQSSDYRAIMRLADKYRINRAVISWADGDAPLFRTLSQYWPSIYKDKYFIILKRP